VTQDLLTAIGLVFVIEGLLYAAAPGKIKAMLGSLLLLGDEQLRVLGLMAALFGVCIVFVSRVVFL
jgi:uncharacterized protein